MTLSHQPGVPGRARRPALSAGAVAAPARPAAQSQAKGWPARRPLRPRVGDSAAGEADRARAFPEVRFFP